MNRMFGGLLRSAMLAAAACVLSAAALGCAGGGDSAKPGLPLLPEAGTGNASGLCVDTDHDGFGEGCAAGADCDDTNPQVTNECYACAHDAPGCACAHEGQRIECGKVTTVLNGITHCGYGGQVCTGGKWSDCEIGAYAPGHNGTQALGSAASCAGSDPCDPYCKQFTDDPSGLMVDGGLVATDAGLQLNTDANFATVDGGADAPSDADLAVLADGGALPEAGAYIFHELEPGQTATDTINTQGPTLSPVDVYLVVDDTGSMREEVTALQTTLSSPSGLVATLKTTLGTDTYVGIGRFEEYAPLFNVPGAPKLPFQHLLSLQPDQIPAGVTAGFIHDDAFGPAGNQTNLGDVDFPTSSVSALWTAAVPGDGLYNTTMLWWVPPRLAWGGAPISTAGFPAADQQPSPSPCPAGTDGYPCWRSNATPLFVLLTDAPSHNGPGGWYAYPENDAVGIGGAPHYTTQPLDGGASFPNAVALPVDGTGMLTTAVYYGRVASIVSNSSVGTGVNQITAGSGRSSLRDCLPFGAGVPLCNPLPLNCAAPPIGCPDAGPPALDRGPPPDTACEPRPLQCDNDPAGPFSPALPWVSGSLTKCINLLVTPDMTRCTNRTVTGSFCSLFPMATCGPGFGHDATMHCCALSSCPGGQGPSTDGSQCCALCPLDREYNPAVNRCCTCRTSSLASIVNGQCCKDAVNCALPSEHVSAGNVHECCQTGPCASPWTLDPATNRCMGQDCNQCDPAQSCQDASPNLVCCNTGCQECQPGAQCDQDAATPACCVDGGCVNVPTPADGSEMGEAIYRFTVPAGKRSYYHFGLVTEHATVNTGDSDPTSFLYLKRKADGDSSPSGPVLDCNKSAENAYGVSHNAVRAEINSYLDQGDYYLIVDNYALNTDGAPRTYDYVLQVGQFDDVDKPTAPSYDQAITKLNAMGAKVIGVDSSGVSCGEAITANMAAYETRDYLDKLAIDTGSVDGTNGNTFNVSVKGDATDCAGTGSTTAIADGIAQAAANMKSALRQDITLRAVDAVPLPSSAMQPPLPGGPAAFVASVTAVVDATATARCGPPPNAPTGPDTVAGYQKFNQCLPDTPVTFDVTFQVPPGVQVSFQDQYFRFDVVTQSGTRGELSRTPVIIKVPALLPIAPADFVRDYDTSVVCPADAPVVWGLFSWDSTDPQTSNIEFFVSTSNTVQGLGNPTVMLVPPPGGAHSTAPNTEVDSTDIDQFLATNNMPRNFPFLRLRAHFTPSGAIPQQSPVLNAWNLAFECRPMQ